ncbi:MAG: tetratricopeptide repeat protein, partial [Sphingomonadaceae bacterium]
MKRLSCSVAETATACFLLSTACSVPVLAQGQSMVSRPVVQALPAREVDDLNAALGRLARNPRDSSALIDAGNAALDLGDVDGAIGFFGRADEYSPGNSRVKMGLARAYLHSERPIEALRLINEAEAAGASTQSVDAERALAYDLVGDNQSAQIYYQRVLGAREDAETRRRLALSQAISGDRKAMEKTLRPLLDQQDRAAFRTRAMGLAVLGETREAQKIVNVVMPGDMAERISPYLGYMPRLTRAQQAAAGNLGIFPRAAQIGHDDPRIAAYSGSSGGNQSVARPAPGRVPSPAVTPAPVTNNSDQRLVPAGRPLGSAVSEKTSSRQARTASGQTFQQRIDDRHNAPVRPGPGRRAKADSTDASPAPADTTGSPRQTAAMSAAAMAAAPVTPAPVPSVSAQQTALPQTQAADTTRLAAVKSTELPAVAPITRLSELAPTGSASISSPAIAPTPAPVSSPAAAGGAAASSADTKPGFNTTLGAPASSAAPKPGFNTTLEAGLSSATRPASPVKTESSSPAPISAQPASSLPVAVAPPSSSSASSPVSTTGISAPAQ